MVELITLLQTSFDVCKHFYICDDDVDDAMASSCVQASLGHVSSIDLEEEEQGDGSVAHTLTEEEKEEERKNKKNRMREKKKSLLNAE